MLTTVANDMSTDMRQCLRNCLDCYELCLRAVAETLRHPDSDSPARVTLMQDCADACRTHAEFLMRRSPRQSVLAAVCADICRACATACREMDGLVMGECATTCDRCADSCDRMARA